MFIIIQSETHPDGCIENTIGPFDTFEQASQIADAFYYHDSNIIKGYGGPQYRFTVYEMTHPRDI